MASNPCIELLQQSQVVGGMLIEISVINIGARKKAKFKCSLMAQL